MLSVNVRLGLCQITLRRFSSGVRYGKLGAHDSRERVTQR